MRPSGVSAHSPHSGTIQATRRARTRLHGRFRHRRVGSLAFTSVEIAVVGSGGRHQPDVLALAQLAGLLIVQFVKRSVGAVSPRGGRTPEVMIGGFPGAVTTGTDRSPSIATALYSNRLLLQHTHSEPTNGMVKGASLICRVKVKVVISPTSPQKSEKRRMKVKLVLDRCAGCRTGL